MSKRCVFINLLLFVTVRGRAPSTQHRDVLTTQGVVRGYFAPHPPRYTFLGVPYARPPTPRDRYKASSPPYGWDGIFEATHHVKCPQSKSGDENCLVVNIFTPEHASSLSVLVHIHGGGFQNGWGSYLPPLRLLKKDIIIVTFNYRIGVLGFLCLDTPDAPGNAGLKDQVSAIYWIQRNIANFGGNPLDITLYGTEAGAASIQLLLLSGLTKGLYHKVILESGSALSPSSLTYNPISTALNAASKLGYKEEEDANKLVKFFQKLPIKLLANISDIFLPCIESDSYYSHSLLNMDPVDILQQKNYQQVPILIIYRNLEIPFNERNKKYQVVPENFEDLLPNNLDFDNLKTKHRIADVVKEFYFGGDRENIAQKYAEYINDLLIVYPVIKSACLHSVKSSQPVYLMRFDMKSSGILSMNDKDRAIVKVVDYVYATDNIKYTDETIAEIIATMWSNFIKLGDPTPLTTSLIPIIWQPITADYTDHAIDIGSVLELHFGKSLKMSSPPSSQHLVFWDHIYKQFYRPHSTSNKDFD